MMSVLHQITRRVVLLTGLSSMVSLAGCLDGLSGDTGPQRRTFELTITRSGDSLKMSVEPSGEVEDVIQVNVGDTVLFDIRNDANEDVGFHDHASDEEFVIAAAEEHTIEFETTESMTGRQEIEGWIAEEDHEGSEDGHGGDAQTLAVIEVRPRGS